MSIPSQRKWDKKHLENLIKYTNQVRSDYIKAVKQIIRLSSNLKLNSNDEFYFRNYKSVNKKVNNILKMLFDDVYGTTVTGINSEWDLAVKKNNEIAQAIYGKDLAQLPKAYKDKYLSNNAQARRNFVYRKDNGLGLSEKVWKNIRQLKTELELSLEVGISSGKSAASIATEAKQYLNDPDKLFRRVKDKKTGELRLSKAAKAYNPGQGRYRSSYKNAFRLTRNETNFSYEGSQKEKRKQQDFIVGIYIRTSPTHNPADDKGGISCIDLQGKYPKTFDWTYKWHVNCLCYSTNIIKTQSELDKDIDLILSGKEPNTKSKNEISKLSKSYTNYVFVNKDKWKNWKSKPRFVINN